MEGGWKGREVGGRTCQVMQVSCGARAWPGTSDRGTAGGQRCRRPASDLGTGVASSSIRNKQDGEGSHGAPSIRWRGGRIMKLLSCCGLHTIFHILLTSIVRYT